MSVASTTKKRAVLPTIAAGLLCVLPPAASAGPVIEFYNTSLDNYFITADAVEAAAIDSGSAGPGWSRTGDTFNQGGVSFVCRFYGSITPGPNSHFYTVDPAECELLKQLQASTPATEKRWNFESLDFVTTAAANGVCPEGTVPVHRAYNNGFTRGIDSNHRITTSLAGIQQVTARGWTSEGIVMCGATAASVAAAAQFWQQAKGVWLIDVDGQTIVIRFDGSGGYLMGSTSAGGDDRPGLERGTLAYDGLTHRAGAIVSQDTNGTTGFSGRGPIEALETFTIESGALVVRDAGGIEQFRLQRAASDQGSIAGVWALDSATDLRAQHFVFMPDGRYLVIDPVGDAGGPGQPSCGGPGIEFGTYTWTPGTGTLRITGVSIDTNGCAGINEPPNATTVFGGESTISGIVLSDGGNVVRAPDGTVLRRVAP